MKLHEKKSGGTGYEQRCWNKVQEMEETLQDPK